MKNDLSGGISSVRPIPSFIIIEICSGVTNALAITSPSLFFLIGIDSGFSSFSILTSGFTSSFLGIDEAFCKTRTF